MNIAMEKIFRLFKDYPDEISNPIVAGSSYFDKIPGALAEWVLLARTIGMTRDTEKYLSTICQTIYVAGYLRGKNERIMPQFIVAEEEAKDG